MFYGDFSYLSKVCGGGSRDYMVSKVILVISLSLNQAEQKQNFITSWRK